MMWMSENRGEVSYPKIAATHVNADCKIVRSLSRTDIDRSDVGIKKCLVVHPSCFHLNYHAIITEIAERWIIDLYMSCKNDSG